MSLVTKLNPKALPPSSEFIPSGLIHYLDNELEATGASTIIYEREFVLQSKNNTYTGPYGLGLVSLSPRETKVPLKTPSEIDTTVHVFKVQKMPIRR
jgi:hypothetical protein